MEEAVGTSQTSDACQETTFTTFRVSIKFLTHLRMTITTLAVNCQQPVADASHYATSGYSPTVLQYLSHLYCLLYWS